MVDAILLKEFEYYVAHQTELAVRYQGRFLVIKQRQVLGDYASAQEAVRVTMAKHSLGTFLVQRCDADPESTKARFHSRVIFA